MNAYNINWFFSNFDYKHMYMPTWNTIEPIFWLFCLLCVFSSRIIVNIPEFDNTVVQSKRFSDITPGLIHIFLHLKMSVPRQEYDSCYPFVFDVFWHLILPWLGTFLFDFSLSSVFLWFYFWPIVQYSVCFRVTVL